MAKLFLEYLETLGIPTLVLGLKRHAVDLEEASVFIAVQQSKMLDGALGLKETKAGRRRMVDLAPALAYALELHLARTDGEYLFPHPVNGGYWHSSTFRSGSKTALPGPSSLRLWVTPFGSTPGHYQDIQSAERRHAVEKVAESVGKLVGSLGLTLEKR